MKRKLTKLLTFVLALSIAFCFTGCSEEKTAKKNLSAMFDDLKKGNYYEAVSTYIYNNENSNDFLKCGDNFNENAFPGYSMHKALFDSLEYKIKESKIINQSEIHFITDVTSIDLTPVGEELADTAAAYNISAANAEEDEKLTENELNDIMTQQLGSISKDYLKSGNVKTVTNEVEIVMGYTEDGKWLVSMTDDLYNVLTGGVYDAFYKVIEESDITPKK